MKKIFGKLINLKPVRVEDAEFILELRQDENLNQYISSTSASLENQREWITNYLERENKEKEFYFIVEDKNYNPCGTVRLYSIEDKEATWGSFMLNSNRPNGASYEVIELSLNFGFEELNLEKILLDVRKDNNKAIHIYEKVGFNRVREDELNYYYEIVKK
ncbi:MAG: GNAT family N-acetyltransferase [Cetobacterium sp.]